MSRTSRAALALTAAAALSLPLALPASAAGLEPVEHLADGAALTLDPLGTYSTGVFDESAQEIVAYHALTRRMFTVDAHAAQVRALDVRNPTKPTELFTVQTTGVQAADGSTVPDGAVANSVVVRPDGLGVVAVESDVKTDRGWLVFFDAAGRGAALGAVRVGALPDMVTVSPDGRTAVVANEGEPADDYSVDPEGSVAVVDLPWLKRKAGSIRQKDVSIADFHAFEGDALPDGVRVFGPDVADASGSLAHRVSRNLEPEYVTVSKDSRTAYVTLQEANAIAVVDLRRARVEDVWSLGSKDHSVAGQGIDPSDRDGAANVRTVPVKGLYMPDTIASYSVRGTEYLVTANEGDAREWGDYVEPARVKDLGEDGLAPVCEDSPAATLLDDAGLGRLNVTTASGLRADGSCYAELYAMGGRSFSIWTTDGDLVFDSGETLEQVTVEALGEAFNTNHSETSFEGRSDDKGPEPEALTIGEVSGRTYAFVGLERAGGVVTFDISRPRETSFVSYVSNRDYSVSVEDALDDGADVGETLAAAGDLGPEGITFVPWYASPTWRPMLAVANEVSGTTTLYDVERPGRR
ncbi:choice-of-anchor I family protein [Isoptericola jiangsuensis]|uniref:choice-of-anchor I family protein n=1 Tax=Isoptericola jiangsuensis TaxID=548579 RepID=UPI003AAD5981